MNMCLPAIELSMSPSLSTSDCRKKNCPVEFLKSANSEEAKFCKPKPLWKIKCTNCKQTLKLLLWNHHNANLCAC